MRIQPYFLYISLIILIPTYADSSLFIDKSSSPNLHSHLCSFPNNHLSLLLPHLLLLPFLLHPIPTPHSRHDHLTLTSIHSHTHRSLTPRHQTLQSPFERWLSHQGVRLRPVSLSGRDSWTRSRTHRLCVSTDNIILNVVRAVWSGAMWCACSSALHVSTDISKMCGKAHYFYYQFSYLHQYCISDKTVATHI